MTGMLVLERRALQQARRLAGVPGRGARRISAGVDRASAPRGCFGSRSSPLVDPAIADATADNGAQRQLARTAARDTPASGCAGTRYASIVVRVANNVCGLRFSGGPFMGISEFHPTMAAIDPFRPGRVHHITRRPEWRSAPASRGNSRASTIRASVSR